MWVHRSVLHSAVEFIDGSVIGQMGLPDISSIICFVLSYADGIMGASFFSMLSAMHFEKPDPDAWHLSWPTPSTEGRRQLSRGSERSERRSCGSVLLGKIKFLEIACFVEDAMQTAQRIQAGFNRRYI